ncbi:hypothetical protein [Tsukamurella pseudospumae]|uniref:Uncharacterized protein n=1 Tax=Tsukamurella pseudospumae TaxID=239498 RepID=A0A138AEM2_9ACTN|nr:hypothetical protein [Tsukamurella pseudospumae]KXP08829.1 hypothetical protein AXK60_09205 [Tsukamurella pseudospumae]
MAPTAWQFWEIVDSVGELQWLGITRPKGRTELERATVWTLIPRTRVFIANWFVSEAWSTEDSGLSFENIASEYARTVALEVPEPSAEDLSRITHPERLLTLDQVDTHTLLKVLGKRVDIALQKRR